MLYSNHGLFKYHFEQNLPLPLPVSGYYFKNGRNCFISLLNSLPVKAGSLDSISDNCSVIEFDDDWDDSMKDSSKTKVNVNFRVP